MGLYAIQTVNFSGLSISSTKYLLHHLSKSIHGQCEKMYVEDHVECLRHKFQENCCILQFFKTNCQQLFPDTRFTPFGVMKH